MRRINKAFFGWRVMWAALLLAVFGWGVGFYGPPVFLYSLEKTHGWSIDLIASAVTVHYVFGAVLVANMPRIYARLGFVITTKLSAICLALGVIGWACVQSPWQLFFTALLSGIGWAGTGAMAVNTIIARWFDRHRPLALSMAYNGASVGGVIFSPLWILLITTLGFPLAAVLVGCVMVAVVWFLAARFFTKTPQQLGERLDGGVAEQEPQRTPAPKNKNNVLARTYTMA